jgi:hypothetical protein
LRRNQPTSLIHQDFIFIFFIFFIDLNSCFGSFGGIERAWDHSRQLSDGHPPKKFWFFGTLEHLQRSCHHTTWSKLWQAMRCIWPPAEPQHKMPMMVGVDPSRLWQLCPPEIHINWQSIIWTYVTHQWQLGTSACSPLQPGRSTPRPLEMLLAQLSPKSQMHCK